MNSLSKYASLVKLSHTVFAMPFALTGFALALYDMRGQQWDATWAAWLLLKVVLCTFFARNTAMGFNRWADRDIDAANPRTAGRDIPAGRISPRSALLFTAANAVLFTITASTINHLTAILSPVALAVITFYSLCKRFTSLAHIALGLSLAIAPAGAYIAVTGHLAPAPCILSLLVATWCAGFDIIYALQDADFDRQNRLHSIPARFPAAVALGISIGLHAVSIAALAMFASYCPQGVLLYAGCGIFTALLIMQHILVTPSRQRNIGIAFGTLNGIASLVLAAFVIADLIIAR